MLAAYSQPAYCSIIPLNPGLVIYCNQVLASPPVQRSLFMSLMNGVPHPEAGKSNSCTLRRPVDIGTLVQPSKEELIAYRQHDRSNE